MTEATPIGRIIGHDISEISIRVPSTIPLRLGELVAAAGSDGDVFLLRIVNLRFAADAATADWPVQVAGNLMASGNEAVLFDAHHRVFHVATATPLGIQSSQGLFRRPKNLPPLFAQVSRPTSEQLAFLQAAPEQLDLGPLRSGDTLLKCRPGISAGALTQHVGVFATTGMGKSNLVKTLAASCLETGGIGLLVLDPHGEYADGGGGIHRDGSRHQGLLHHPKAAENLVVFSSRPVAGFSGRVQTLQIPATEISASDLSNLMRFSEAQQEAIWAASNRFGRTWLVRLAQDEPANLASEFGNKIHEGTWNVLCRRAHQIVSSDSVHIDGALSTVEPVLVALSAGKVVLVDTSSLLPQEELLVSAVIARRVLEAHRTLYRTPAEFAKLPPVCITLEEAQRVLNQRSGDQNVFAQIAREGRKFKVGLAAVTQQPRLISDELLSQLNTLFILGLADPTDRQRVAQGARQDLSASTREIQLLEPGEVLITTPGAPFALPIRADLYEHRIAAIAPTRKHSVPVSAEFF